MAKYPIGHPMEYSVKVAYVNVEKKSDGAAGKITVWEDGYAFDAVVNLDQSDGTKIAEQSVVVDIFNVVVMKGEELEENTIIRRTEQNDYLKIISNPNDDESAKFNTDDTKRFKAKKIAPPSDAKLIIHYDVKGNEI